MLRNPPDCAVAGPGEAFCAGAAEGILQSAHPPLALEAALLIRARSTLLLLGRSERMEGIDVVEEEEC